MGSFRVCASTAAPHRAVLRCNCGLGRQGAMQGAAALTAVAAGCTLQGVFTQDFCMNEPGNATITINNYQNRGLRTNQTTSKVHRELDVDF
jgi:hypothetical protein